MLTTVPTTTVAVLPMTGYHGQATFVWKIESLAVQGTTGPNLTHSRTIRPVAIPINAPFGVMRTGSSPRQNTPSKMPEVNPAIASASLTTLSEKELKRAGEFVLPGMVKLVVQKRKARMGRNPATGEAIKIPAKTVVKARIAKQLKDAVLPRK